MKVLTAGHKYELDNFEVPGLRSQTLQFIEKVPDPENPTGPMITLNNGTTNEEVLSVLIDRLTCLQNKFPCKENACAITHLQEAKMWLEERTRNRVNRNVEGRAVK
jgi:hypothetical protein